MNKLIISIIFVLILSMISSCSPLKMKERFDPVGEYTPQKDKNPIVPSKEDIKIYYNSFPEGFSVNDDVISVNQEYNHKILGVIKLKYSAEGYCDVGELNKDTVIEGLKKLAYKVGANAVILAYSALGDNPNYGERCYPPLDIYGAGWAVVLK